MQEHYTISHHDFILIFFYFFYRIILLFVYSLLFYYLFIPFTWTFTQQIIYSHGLYFSRLAVTSNGRMLCQIIYIHLQRYSKYTKVLFIYTYKSTYIQRINKCIHMQVNMYSWAIVLVQVTVGKILLCIYGRYTFSIYFVTVRLVKLISRHHPFRIFLYTTLSPMLYT